jgi:inward rectifier potassium channel
MTPPADGIVVVGRRRTPFSDPSSPLHGATPETLARDEVELMLTIIGIDETSAQNVHARHTYGHEHIRWGARHADMLSELDDGRLQLDVREFHRVVPTAPTATFPHPRTEVIT